MFFNDANRRRRYVAAPQYGTMVFSGLQSKRVYNVDIYHSDVVDGLLKWDGGAGSGANSPDSFTPPEAVVLVDYAIVTGMTDTTKLQLMRNNQPTGDFLRYTQHLTTSAQRSPMLLGFAAGVQVRAIQKA